MKVSNVAPSTIPQSSDSERLQERQEWKILDNRPGPNTLPSCGTLVYSNGFGECFDIFYGSEEVPGFKLRDATSVEALVLTSLLTI